VRRVSAREVIAGPNIRLALPVRAAAALNNASRRGALARTFQSQCDERCSVQRKLSRINSTWTAFKRMDVDGQNRPKGNTKAVTRLFVRNDSWFHDLRLWHGIGERTVNRRINYIRECIIIASFFSDVVTEHVSRFACIKRILFSKHMFVHPFVIMWRMCVRIIKIALCVARYVKIITQIS